MIAPKSIEERMDAPEPTKSQEPTTEPPFGAKYVSIERRSQTDTVFLVDDVPFRSAMPRTTHWSVAWSDLMMTMFVLFLSMYVYKAADQDFLNRPALEIIGGDTTEALDTDKFSAASPPIIPIAPGLPLMTGGTVKKAESINLRDVDIDSAFSSVSDQTRIEKEVVEVPADRVIPPQPEPGVMTSPEKSESGPQQPPAMAATDTGPSLPIGVGRPDKIQEIYRLSKSALESNNLSSFAAVDLIVDNTMRIILTGDLLFDTGQAVMPQESRDKLEQVATAIQTTPYMINVIGHTDNVPMYSGRYNSNWELSVARASTVARFLIEEMGMNPNQFVVSGYASYRPMVSNATAENRKKNRRVEIIISKRLPNPVPADQQTLR